MCIRDRIHILQTFPDWPAESAAINWIGLGNTEHSVFIPFFSGITDTADAYKVDGDTYDAVSYTHLDVYKRQPGRWCSPGGARRCSPPRW